MLRAEWARESSLFGVGIDFLLVSYLLPDLVNEDVPFFRGFAPKGASDSQDVTPPQQRVLPDTQKTRNVVVSPGGQGQIPTDEPAAWKAFALVEKSLPGKVVHYSYRLRLGDFDGIQRWVGAFSGKQRDIAPRSVTPALQIQVEARGIVSDGSDEPARPGRKLRSIQLSGGHVRRGAAGHDASADENQFKYLHDLFPSAER